ncbi:helix-turn-helix domain-containing protein [Sinomicrobium oceani]|uniref:helix-turn-helix domain-containing protein n=1 Tax=Sinomicrobium oceani TaxID=1150368 RepID=UPI00227C67DB|nr:helix-turn-helix domain-containing protein [Sinomicrobium oceani]
MKFWHTRPYLLHRLVGEGEIPRLEPLLTGAYGTMILVETGSLLIEVDRNMTRLSPLDLYIVNGNKVRNVRAWDLDTVLYSFSLPLSPEVGYRIGYRWPAWWHWLMALRSIKITPSPRQATPLLQGLGRLLDTETQDGKGIRALLELLKQLVLRYLPEKDTEWPASIDLTFRFMQLLELHFREQHHVHVYARALHVNADYLSRAVRDTVHGSAKQCIEQHLLDAAVRMLGGQDPITTIRDELGFSTSSQFSHFFKKHTSLTPSEFRRLA